MLDIMVGCSASKQKLFVEEKFKVIKAGKYRSHDPQNTAPVTSLCCFGDIKASPDNDLWSTDFHAT